MPSAPADGAPAEALADLPVSEAYLGVDPAALARPMLVI